MRLLSLLLALVSCFVIGVFYGKINILDADTEKAQVEQSLITEADVAKEVIHREEDAFIFKVAATLEAIVSSIYDLIVTFLYGIAKIFFK